MQIIQSDESATVTAELYNVTSDYVRKLVTGKRTPLGKQAKLKAKAILHTYWLYKSGKVQLLEKAKRSVNI